MSPDTILINDDLPAPFGPIMVNISPGIISKLIFLKIFLLSKK